MDALGPLADLVVSDKLSFLELVEKFRSSDRVIKVSMSDKDKICFF